MLQAQSKTTKTGLECHEKGPFPPMHKAQATPSSPIKRRSYSLSNVSHGCRQNVANRMSVCKVSEIFYCFKMSFPTGSHWLTWPCLLSLASEVFWWSQHSREWGGKDSSSSSSMAVEVGKLQNDIQVNLPWTIRRGEIHITWKKPRNLGRNPGISS